MAPKKDYTPLQMSNAIDAVRKGDKIGIAAQKYGVPRVTLRNKITGKSPIDCSMGPNTYLSKEEEYILERWIVNMHEMHIPITKEELLDSVQRIITDKRKITPFINNRPGKKWYNLFLKRHPIISERTAQNLTTARDNVTEDGINKWFGEIEGYLREKDLMSVTESPERVFNTDESAFYLSPKAGKVLAKRGDKHIYQSSGDEKENLTVLLTGNAAGQLAPPLVVFNYERIPSTISSLYPPDWGIGRSPSGWMCGGTFYEYITNVFNPWLLKENIKKPILFFLDGHRSHLTLHLSNFCAANGIEIIALYPNSTHILQPMDLAIFRPLKSYWKKAVNNWKLEHMGQNLKKEHFASVLKTALQSISKDSIKHGFRAGGLHPFGPSYVDFSKIKSSRKSQEDRTAQIHFLRCLEKEIVSKFGSEKLQFFKELFNKSRNEVDNNLPEEDVSLYVIWASNKQADYCPCPDNVASTSTVPAIQANIEMIEDLSTVRNSGNICLENDESASTSSKQQNYPEVIKTLPPANTSHSDSPAKNMCQEATKEQLNLDSTQSHIDPHPTSSHPIPYLDVVKAPSSDTVTNPDNTTSSASGISHRERVDIELLKFPATENIQVSKSIVPEIVKYSSNVNSPKFFNATNVSFLESAANNISCSSNQSKCTESSPSASGIPHKEQVDIECLNLPAAENTPSKKPFTTNNPLTNIFKTNPLMESDLIIPSPFKRNLFWPEKDESAANKKRKLKEKIPFTITGDSWRMYHEKKKEEKEQKEKEKERKSKEREERKLLKAQKSKTKKTKPNKTKPKLDDTSSDDTDYEIKYAESNDSYCMEEDEEELYIEQPKTRKRTIPEQVKNSSIYESENIPLSQISKKPKSYSVGNYVVIEYEGEYFPGLIENKQGNNYKISTMTFSVGNTYKWPEKPDTIWYTEKDILEIIKEPVLTNKRGFYSIKEMNKYLPFTT